MQGTLFQRCILYCSVMSLGGNVNTRRMSNPDIGSIFHIKNLWNILFIGNYYMNIKIFQIQWLILTSSATIRKMMDLFLFTNSAQYVSLHYNLGMDQVFFSRQTSSLVVFEVKRSLALFYGNPWWFLIFPCNWLYFCFQLLIKELSFCHKLNFSNLFICATQYVLDLR